MLLYKKKLPFVEGVAINKLLKVQPTPFYVYSQKNITNSFIELKKTIGKNIFYSVKANSNQAILKIMKNLGLGADVVSIGELKRALKAGFAKSKIIFEGVGKTKEDIIFAINSNIRQINIESIEEISLINNLSKNLNLATKVGIRINPDIDGETIKKISTGRKTDKFGVTLKEIDTVINILKKSKYLKLMGISCHVGSQINNLQVYKKVFKSMKNIASKFINSGFSISHVDLGGGISVQYKNTDPIIKLNKLKKEISKFFKNEPYEISFEPGRYLVAKSGLLITKILTTKKNGGINYLITDAGMHSFIRPALYNANHMIETFKPSKAKKIIYTIAGPICESTDILAKNISMQKQNTGDVLIIKDVGAYGAVMASNYNSRGLPAEILVNKNSFSIIYEPKKIEEYIDEEFIPNWLL